MIYRIVFKRLFDFIFALLLLIFLFPVLLFITCCLFFQNRGNPFFIQTRVGKNGSEFKIIKFKTMIDAYDEKGKPLPDHLRITNFGNLLRKLSLDELPQLLNVLGGNMSFIGPRPLLLKYLELYDDFQIRRHEITPGITGWAQVNGRNAISWEEKFKLDVWYVDHISFSLDFKIVLLTILKIFKREGINAGEQETMKAFTGSKSSE